MKYVWCAIALIGICAGLLMMFGDQMIKRRHTIGGYAHELTNGNYRPITNAVIWSGLQLALQENGMDRNHWALSPRSRWHPAIEPWQLGNELKPIVILLSNQTDGTEIYVRVELLGSSNILSYDLYRPK